MKAAFAGLAMLLGAAASCNRPTASRLTVYPARIPADGYSTATLRIDPPAAGATVTSDDPHIATVSEVTPSAARIQAGITPGRTRIRVTFRSAPPAEAAIETLAFLRDSTQDGTPDFLRLEDDRDQQQFRHAFTRLAEAQYFEPLAARPPEIKDCSALIRYAYREALRTSPAKYRYPYTPLGAALWRVQPGPFRAADLANGAFAQFADAKTLCHLNSYLVSRVLSAALPGDLLFFRQPAGAERYHSMIYLGESRLQNNGRSYILYHTGPSGTDPGEMRRLTVEELMHFPRPEWRPLAGNPRFLGVFRWNILRKEIDTPPR